MESIPDTISSEEARTAVRVLKHVLNHGMQSIPATLANELLGTARNLAAGRGARTKVNARCYICRRERHYEIRPNAPPLCTECTAFNDARRKDIEAPGLFAEMTAVVTGGRINLGYAVALVLLRGGASNVIVTSRFPEDALRRYKDEVDYDSWSSHLQMVQSDFTSAASIQHTIQSIHKLTKGRLDILINNAAQTVPISDAERERLLTGEMSVVVSKQHQLSALDGALITLTGPYVNSWTASYNEFTYRELLDALAVNAVAPFVIIRECVELMQHNVATHIINVTSREGMFEPGGHTRSSKHVHTNMAKAALNMMTQTLSREFIRSNLFINSVDPGFLSHQHSLTHNGIDGKIELDVPLTWADGAARVLTPVVRKVPITGAFFKDYRERDWIRGYM